MNYLPSKLNKLRKHYSYSQQFVADKLGIDVIEYMGLENGNSMVNYSQMKKLASLYHISMNEMFLNSDEVQLFDTKGETDEINARYFMPENNLKNKIKGFVINHKVASIIIGILLIAIIVLSIILNNVVRPYEIFRENINRLSVSNTTVIYIEDSGAIGFTGSNSNGQLNDLAVTGAVKVCEGDGFSAVLNEDGTVVTSGLISKYSDEIQDWEHIIDIAAGGNHLVGLDANGRVYCTGDETPCDIEGTRNIKKIFATKNASIALNEVGTLSYSGSLIGSSYLKEYYNVKDIASSDNILVILNSESSLNVYSKNGSYLKAETWNDIVDVACGSDFVAALDSYGKVYIEINNDDIKDKVSEWSNIIAIDAGDDYLIGFDGKNIHGVGNNNYNQFVKENKQKVTLEMVKNIEYSLTLDSINIQFDGVNNASGYLVELNVGTGLSNRVESEEIVSFLTENMINGKTYTITITSLGTGDFKDSDEATYSFVYNKPDSIEVNISEYVGKSRAELEEYLTTLDLTYKAEENIECACKNDVVVTEINGIQDGVYTRSELDTAMVKYKYCKVSDNDE